MFRSFLAIDRALTLFVTSIVAVHNGVWLGLLRPAALDRLTGHVYSGRDLYVDEAHNRFGLFRWEQVALERHFVGRQSILVPACGGGA